MQAREPVNPFTRTLRPATSMQPIAIEYCARPRILLDYVRKQSLATDYESSVLHGDLTFQLYGFWKQHVVFQMNVLVEIFFETLQRLIESLVADAAV